MKKLVTIIIFLMSISISNAQFRPDSYGISYNTMGKNVGVGTNSSSAYELYVRTTDETASIYGYNSANSSSSRYGIKSRCQNSGTGGAYGLYSEVTPSGLGSKFAVYGNTYNSTSATSWAGYFNGRGYFKGKVGTGSNPEKNTINFELQLLNHSSKIAFGDNNYTGAVNGVNCFVGEYIKPDAVDSDMLQLHGKSGMHFTTGSRGLLTNNSVTLMSNGNFGIGTTDPNHKLAVIGQTYLSGNVGIGTTNTKGYKLGVNGKIAATEVIVAQYANWPDYVFESEYKLPKLDEVEKFIKENKHLPDVPSAKEVSETGIQLGEMNKTLLKKIEELTLYVIELKKENKKIQEQLIELKNQ